MKNPNSWKPWAINRKCSTGVLLASLAVAPVMVSQLHAQEVEKSTAALEEITVTAERRSASVQDVPISISAITGETLKKSSIFNTEAFSYSVPGMIIERDVVGKVVIRGIGTENFTVGGDPGVATYVDGAYIARASVGIFDFFDVERVEVLRGPQGTLYGRNAVGGVINVISRSPTQELEAYANLTYGNYNAKRIESAVSGGITDHVRARIAGLYSKRDGFTKNIFPGIKSRGLDELDTKDLWAVRGRVDVDLSAALKLELIGDIYRDDSNPPAFWFTDDTVPWETPTTVYPRDIRTVSQGYETTTPGLTGVDIKKAGRQDQTGITGRLTWEGDGFTVKSTTAYRNIKFDWISDGDGISDFVVTYLQKDYSKQFTQDIHVASNNDSAFQWILGAFYLNEKARGDYLITLGGFSTLFYGGTNTTNAYGVFVEGKYTFKDLSFTAGVRYSDEKKHGTLDYKFPFVESAYYDQTKNYNAITPRFIIDYRIAEDAHVYASATRGFKSGGFSFLVNPLNSFDEEFVWSYEAGVKSQLFAHRLKLNASAFYYDYKDQQLSQATHLATRTTNAGSSTIWGMELEMAALVTEKLRVEGNLAYLHTKFNEYCTVDTRNPSLPIDTAVCGDTPNLAGNELPRSPDWTANLAVTYTENLTDNLKGDIRGEWQYTGHQFFSVFNRPQVAQNGISVFNASVGVTGGDGWWSARAWVRNLANKTYFSNIFESGVVDNLVIPQAFVAPPRTYGLTLSFNY